MYIQIKLHAKVGNDLPLINSSMYLECYSLIFQIFNIFSNLDSYNKCLQVTSEAEFSGHIRVRVPAAPLRGIVFGVIIIKIVFGSQLFLLASLGL